MKKIAGGFSPIISIDRTLAKPLHEQICDAYRAAIRNGNLGAAEKVPSSRELALELGVSRPTVSTAYEQLVAEELFERRKGAGTFIAKALPQQSPTHGNRKKGQPSGNQGSRTISRMGSAARSLGSWPWLFGQGAFAVGQVALDSHAHEVQESGYRRRLPLPRCFKRSVHPFTSARSNQCARRT